MRARRRRQARHDARLLVVAHPLLEEVGLAPAAGPEHASTLQTCCWVHAAATSFEHHQRSGGAGLHALTWTLVNPGTLLFVLASSGRPQALRRIGAREVACRRRGRAWGGGCTAGRDALQAWHAGGMRAGAHCSESCSIHSKGLAVW